MLGQVSHIDAEGQIGLHLQPCWILTDATEYAGLIELNLSDESLLQRDLGALLKH